MPAATIPVQRTQQLWDAGWTHERIAALYVSEGIPCTPSGLSKLKGRLGLVEGEHRHLPFRVRAEHANDYLAHVVRYWLRAERGERINETEARKIRYLVRRLERENSVVAYVDHPSRDGGSETYGWTVTPRRHGVDNGPILFNHEVPL